MQTELTVHELIEFSKLNDVFSAIKYAEQQYGDYPIKPSKPVLTKRTSSKEVFKYAEQQYGDYQYGDYLIRPSKPVLTKRTSSKEVFEYAERLARWEQDNANWKNERDNWYENKRKIDSIIETFIKDISGISIVPEQYREKLYSKAWSDGHSSGFYEVYTRLQSLIEIFE